MENKTSRPWHVHNRRGRLRAFKHKERAFECAARIADEQERGVSVTAPDGPHEMLFYMVYPAKRNRSRIIEDINRGGIIIA